MNKMHFLRRAAQVILPLAFGCIALCSCDDTFIYDFEGDCSVNYKVRFKFDYNMYYADAFNHDVANVSLYLYDIETGDIVWNKTMSRSQMETTNLLGGDVYYVMDIPSDEVAPGDYGIVVWAGDNDEGSFSILSSMSALSNTDLQAMVTRWYDSDGTPYNDTYLDRLYHNNYEQAMVGDVNNNNTKVTPEKADSILCHNPEDGSMPTITLPEYVGTYYYTIPLIKDTNLLTVVLQHTSGDAVDCSKFEFKLIADNGRLDWDNTLLDDETIEFRAYNVEQGEGEIYTDHTLLAYPEEGSVLSRATGDTRATYAAAAAQMSMCRLVLGDTMWLKVTNKETGEDTFIVNLIDYLRMCYSVDERCDAQHLNIGCQEYFDREDTWSVVFLLDEGDRWMDQYIYINSWKVVKQDVIL